MKLLALVEAPDHVCCRYRVRAFEPALAAASAGVGQDPSIAMDTDVVVGERSVGDHVFDRRHVASYASLQRIDRTNGRH